MKRLKSIYEYNVVELKNALNDNKTKMKVALANFEFDTLELLQDVNQDLQIQIKLLSKQKKSA